MAKFIELKGLYSTSDIDYEALGISVSKAVETSSLLRTLVNIENITEINETEDGTTIEFVSGERYLFEDSYDEVKDKLMNNAYGK